MMIIWLFFAEKLHDFVITIIQTGFVHHICLIFYNVYVFILMDKYERKRKWKYIRLFIIIGYILLSMILLSLDFPETTMFIMFYLIILMYFYWMNVKELFLTDVLIRMFILLLLMVIYLWWHLELWTIYTFPIEFYIIKLFVYIAIKYPKDHIVRKIINKIVSKRYPSDFNK